jgi:hypothetical protein
MSSDLHEQLADLAGRAPTPAPGGAGALWAAGKRRQRRRTTAGALAAAALIAGVGSLGLALPGDGMTAAPSSVAPTGTSRLPDHLYAPSQWLEGTAEDGPIGPLAVVIGGQFRHDTDAPGLVGVSAVTGEYRFLDLPGRHSTDLAEVSEIAVSADGRRVAYWYGAPEVERDFGVPADGVAVYDTVTGKVSRHAISSPTTLLGDSLVWVGDRVALTAFDADPESKTAANDGQSAVWRPGDDSFTLLPKMIEAWDVSVARQRLVAPGGRTMSWIALNGDVQRIPLSVLQDGAVFVSPDGRQVATRRDPDNANEQGDQPAPVLVGSLTRRPARETPVALEDVAGPKVHQVLGWRDGDHVVVMPELKGEGPFEYASLDVRSGQVKTLVVSGFNAGGGNYAFASEAWTWPTMEAVEPDWPLDGRVLPGLLGAGALLLGGLAFATWRRSRVRG